MKTLCLKKILFVGFSLVFIATISPVFAIALAQESEPCIRYIKKSAKTQGPKYPADRLILGLRKGISKKRGYKVCKNNDLEIKSYDKYLRFIVAGTKAKDIEKACKRLAAREKSVEYAEPDYYVHAFFTPNDPYFILHQWNINSSASGIDMTAAWDITTGDPHPIIAVLDTGVAYEDYDENGDGTNDYLQAPDLGGTSFVAGYDFVNSDTHPNDDNWHGTFVTEIIAAAHNNSYGCSGIAFRSRIMPVKVLDHEGSGSISEVAQGIEYAVNLGADVINMSLGTYSDSTTLRRAIRYAYNSNVVLVAASGNDALSYPAFPAGYDSYVISVGATDLNKTLASYSNLGVSVVAPGGDISVDSDGDGYYDGIGIYGETIIPADSTAATPANPLNFGFYLGEGTSFAAPHVAAIAALLISYGVATTPLDVMSAIEQTADDLGSEGLDSYYGYGHINAEAALNWTPTP